jgi:bacteriocin-like protein
MSKTNDTSRSELTEDELNAVSGGFRITNVYGNGMGPVHNPSPQAPPVVLYHEPVHA